MSRVGFRVITGHDKTAAHDAWAELAGDDLLVIRGQEIVTRPAIGRRSALTQVT
ncbi:hypothetical protein SPF06_03925 [Sinomonas sp. JGH33]|uniref:Uncharacterized protein n=1 Tax=Sinomonas terricola TaxID=3110330 RepID=A0ABU5T2H5_9MICC|nr:hypothetical protein [Sinomonas sp. JGH33]MEA5453862.1 hypothetical protein [Sinomonas sp. JGH33]